MCFSNEADHLQQNRRGATLHRLVQTAGPRKMEWKSLLLHHCGVLPRSEVFQETSEKFSAFSG
jgi:hypothetical protein